MWDLFWHELIERRGVAACRSSSSICTPRVWNAVPRNTRWGSGPARSGALALLDDVRLPADALLGEEGRGFHMMMSVLDKGRVGIAALAVGIAQAGLEAAVEYAQQRKQFKQPIAEFQGVQWLLADMAKDVEACTAARPFRSGQDRSRARMLPRPVRWPSVLLVTWRLQRTSDACRSLAAPDTFSGFEVERLYRDAKITQIYEGTNQIQRMIIAREVVKHGAAV